MGRRMILLCSLALIAACGSPRGDEVEMPPEDQDTPAAPVASGGEASIEATVVAQLNEMCEENWCAGEFRYEFLTLECTESTCELFFRAQRGSDEFADSVVFDYDAPLLDEGDLEAGYWERINDAISDEWEPAQDAG